jgi:hypothetical protein
METLDSGIEEVSEHEVKRNVDRVTPKMPYEMTVQEILTRIEQVKIRGKRAVSNYEFYYYNELKEEIADLRKELKNRRVTS